MKDKEADRFISVQVVAGILSCTDQYVYSLIQMGSLKAIKLGERALRVSEQSLQAFIASCAVNPEDYFAPEEPPSPGEPQKPKTARSNWMAR